MKKIYIITGANGFLGNNIIRKLEQDADNEIRAFVLNGDSIKSLEKLRCKIYYGDVTKKETLSSIFENIDGKEVFVIHCAAVVYIKSKYNPLVYNVNVNGTKNIVDKVIESKAKLIYISSVHAIPEQPNNELITEITNFNPDNVKGLYAKTKAEAAKYVLDAVKNKNTDYCCNGDDPASINSTFLLVVTYFASDRYIFCRSYDTKSKYTIGKLKPRSRKMETDGTKILRSV